MRKIEILDDLRLRFPGREAEFDVGIEVGAISVLLAQGQSLVRRQISDAATEQLRPIARHFGYTLVATDAGAGMMSVSFMPACHRPRLRIVESAAR